MSKKFIAGLVAGIVLAGGGVAAAQSIGVTFANYKIVVDGVDKTPANGQFTQDGVSVPASIVYNDRTYVPLRMAANLVGKPVRWNQESQTIVLGGQTTNTWLSDLSPSSASSRVSVNEPNKLKLNGKEYQKGIFMGYVDNVIYPLNSQYRSLSLTVGMQDGYDNSLYRHVDLQIIGDGKVLWKGVHMKGTPPIQLTLDVTAVKDLEFFALADSSDVVIGNPELSPL